MKVTEWSSVRPEEVQDGRLLRLTLAAGKGNVIDHEVARQLREALCVLGPERGLRAILLDHDGEHFSYGASVPEHLPGKVEAMLGELHGLARDLWALHLPVLASVRGACLGGGLEVALLADRVFASPTARFGQPEAQLGVFAPLGSLLLEEAVGPRRAGELLLSGRVVGAEEAHAIGLADELADDPSAAAEAWAREHLLPKSASSLRYVTRALRRRRELRLAGELAELERIYLRELAPSRDAREGITAFLEKRPADWEDA